MPVRRLQRDLDDQLGVEHEGRVVHPRIFYDQAGVQHDIHFGAQHHGQANIEHRHIYISGGNVVGTSGARSTALRSMWRQGMDGTDHLLLGNVQGLGRVLLTMPSLDGLCQT
jgi:hypothetical protein